MAYFGQFLYMQVSWRFSKDTNANTEYPALLNIQVD